MQKAALNLSMRLVSHCRDTRHAEGEVRIIGDDDSLRSGEGMLPKLSCLQVSSSIAFREGVLSAGCDERFNNPLVWLVLLPLFWMPLDRQ